MHKSWMKVVAIGILTIALAIALMASYAFLVSKTPAPVITPINITQDHVKEENGLRLSGKNWMRKSDTGLYELYAEGKPLDRGLAIGRLCQDLLYEQERVFANQMKQFVPSKSMLQFLQYFVGWFNRKIDDYTPLENKLEIFGISQYASTQFDYIAPAYQRLLNYHGAHDLGHALQNLSLVGCSSFAVWSKTNEVSPMLIGRNFDFFVGHEFAKNKIIHFIKPDSGYAFMHVSFAGMMGVLSGMNEAGLTVTINAAKSSIPSSSATPVSIVARQILQYAGTLDEAENILRHFPLFVSETFLVSSSKDLDACILEASIDTVIKYNHSSPLICTNHFQSDYFKKFKEEQEHQLKSASVPRFKRIEQLIHNIDTMDVFDVASILRDKRAFDGKIIGLGNENAINQLIAHHSVIFDPIHLRCWISTGPYNLGRYVCYHLPTVLQYDGKTNVELYDKSMEIPEDNFMFTDSFRLFEKYNQFRYVFQDRTHMNVDSMMVWNSDSYYPYLLAADKAFEMREYSKAKQLYETSLSKELPCLGEKEYIVKKLEKVKEKI